MSSQPMSLQPMTLQQISDPSLAIVDLMDALEHYRLGTDRYAIDWVSACLLRISGEEGLPAALRMLAMQLYQETCLQAGTLSGHSLSLLSAILH